MVVVVFLGGDQFWTVLLSARLGYRHLTYAEWVARWPRWNDRIAAMGPAAADRLAKRWQPRCQVVGDLMADLSSSARSSAPLPSGEWVALLPGSKRAKLQVGMPFLLRCAEALQTLRPQTQFLLALAPPDQIGKHDGKESVDSVWFSPKEALDSAASGRFNLPFPTIRNLIKLGVLLVPTRR